MKKYLLTIIGLLMASLTFAQVHNNPTCAYCGEPIDKHKAGCIQADTQLLDSLYGCTKPMDNCCDADTFVVDFNNKAQILRFKDPAVKRCALVWDRDKDGELSVAEAETVKSLWLMYPSRKDMFVINAYDDLRFFPNLEFLHAGKSWKVEVIDLSHNPKLKEVNLYHCDWKTLKEVRYAEGLKMVQKPSQDSLSHNHGLYDEPDVYVREDLADKPEEFPSDRYHVNIDNTPSIQPE